MCILLKLHYAKFDVSRLFCSKVIEKKTFGGVGSTPLGKGRVKMPGQTPIILFRAVQLIKLLPIAATWSNCKTSETLFSRPYRKRDVRRYFQLPET